MFLDPDDDQSGVMFRYPLPVPDEDPSSGDLVKIQVNRKWLGLVSGACMALTQDQTWLTTTDEEQALAFHKAMDLLVQLNTPIVDEPFYEDDDTADGTPDTGAPWYEDVSDWIIAAFLATTFTPNAAIVYRATIPRLRLAFRTGNVGAIVRVLINDIEIWTGNTNAPTVGLLEQELDVETFAAEHNLGPAPWEMRIVHGGAPVGLTAHAETTAYKLEVELGDIRPREASVQLRQNGCALEVSTDGVSWVSLYNPSDCVDGLIQQGIQDAIDDGLIQQQGAQASPSEAPAAGQCRTFHVLLSGNNTWISPVPVNAGDSIMVENGKGAWNDGFLEGFLLWQCPDGRAFGVDSCTIPDDPDPSDPLQTTYHMRLIGRNSVEWFDPWLAYTVPAGITDEHFILQANDSDLSDNKGSVEFDVTVCSGRWEHVFDFRTGTSPYWTPHVFSGHTYALYHAGTGYGVNYNHHAISLDTVNWPVNLNCHIQVVLDRSPSGADRHFVALVGSTTINVAWGTLATHELDITNNAKLFWIDFDDDLADSGGTAYTWPGALQQIIVSGSGGSDPFV